MNTWSSAYKRHGRIVKAFLLRRVGSREAADDLCQETFVRAMQADDDLRDPAKMRPYLLRIAHNLSLNYLRDSKRLRSESELAGEVKLELVAAAGTDGPEQRHGWKELSEALSAALSELSEEQCRAFELGVLQRRPYAEIERLTGWSRSKVKVSVYRARKQLMHRLQEFRPFTAAETNRKGGLS
jgi:RNA polymerase sigma-70 factor (ECF subfamily)